MLLFVLEGDCEVAGDAEAVAWPAMVKAGQAQCLMGRVQHREQPPVAERLELNQRLMSHGWNSLGS